MAERSGRAPRRRANVTENNAIRPIPLFVASAVAAGNKNDLGFYLLAIDIQ